MASITFDAQSFIVAGKRHWIVSGSLDYFRIPRADWSTRIRDAIDAGLNTVLVRCPWALHEPRKGEFVFDGENDVGEFIGLLADNGLKVILRPGPYVGRDLDMGGLPSWLLSEEGILLREGEPHFLDAVSRYLGKLFKVLSPHSGRNGGPIVLVQVEHEWYCGNQTAADRYLLEIARFIREHDFDLPLINCNSLWQRREETIDTWSGYDNLLQNLRQLRSIHPLSPLMVGEFWVSDIDRWNHPHAEPVEPMTLLRNLTEVLAAGAQFNLAAFHGGTNFDFSAARRAGTLDEYETTSADGSSPLGEAGIRRDSFRALRKVCTFASQFARVFANLSPQLPQAALSLAQEGGAKRKSLIGPSVVHLPGTQGEVLFIFGGEHTAKSTVTVLLPNGAELPIHMGRQPVMWCLLDTHVGGHAKLDFTNLCAFACNGTNMLVLYGPGGTTGVVSINQGVSEIRVPGGMEPVVEIHEDVTVVVCNEDNIDYTMLRNGFVHIGVEGFDAQGEPIPKADWKRRWIVHPGGRLETRKIIQESTRKARLRLSSWRSGTVDAHIKGTAPRYATIDGPSTQEQCAAGSGYGFVKIAYARWPKRKMTLMSPGIGDRVHIYVKSALKTILGHGPGATSQPFELTPPAGSKAAIVALVDNLGRYGGGNAMEEGKGLMNHFYEVTQRSIGDPEKIIAAPRDPFVVRAFLDGLHSNSVTTGRDVVWSFLYRSKTPIILEIKDAQSAALVLMNDAVVAFYSGHTGRPLMQLILDENNGLRRGKNELRVCPLSPGGDDEIIAGLKVYEAKNNLTDKATWAYAKCEQPRLNLFRDHDAKRAKASLGRPIWYRATFSTPKDGEPIWLEPNGLSKGLIYLNEHNLGRYFVADHTGAPIGPQKRYHLPLAWLTQKGPNELVLFEEHGFAPNKVRLVHGDSAF